MLRLYLVYRSGRLNWVMGKIDIFFIVCTSASYSVFKYVAFVYPVLLYRQPVQSWDVCPEQSDKTGGIRDIWIYNEKSVACSSSRICLLRFFFRVHRYAHVYDQSEVQALFSDSVHRHWSWFCTGRHTMALSLRRSIFPANNEMIVPIHSGSVLKFYSPNIGLLYFTGMCLLIICYAMSERKVFQFEE